MIRWWKQFRALRKKRRAIEICQKFGHRMIPCGEVAEAKMVRGVPVATGKAVAGLYKCEGGCGHGEVDELGRLPYKRSWKEAEELKQEGAEANGISANGVGKSAGK